MHAARLGAFVRSVASLRARAHRLTSRASDSSAGLDEALDELAVAHSQLADAHKELSRRKSFTDALLETIEVGIVSCDADGVFVVSNRTERELFGLVASLEGLKPEQLNPLITVFDLDGVPLTPESYPLMRALRGEDVAHVNVRVGRSDGPQREVVVRASQMRGPAGEVLGAVAALTDVTSERTAMRTLLEERRKLAEAQLLGQLGGFDHDPSTGVWTFSDQLCALWGAAPGTLTPQRCQSLVVDQDRRGAEYAWQVALASAGHHSFEFRVRRADDGAERVLRARMEVLLGTEGRAVHVRGTHLDITDLKSAQKAARRANAFSAAVLAASPNTTLVTDLTTGSIVYASAGKDILGFPVEHFTALGAEAITARIHPDDQARVLAFTAAAATLEDGQTQQQRYRTTGSTGEWRWLNHCLTPFRRDASGAVVEVLAVVRDITDVVQAEQMLTHAARHDSLTGLPNRAQLVDTLEEALDRSRDDGQEVAVLFIDLDGFKDVNDAGGHSAGDAVLRETARRLEQVVRGQDTVARVGGDEFVVVVASGGEPVRAVAVTVAERIAAVASDPIDVRGSQHVVTASIGITFATLARSGRTGDITVDDVLHRADVAMYRAKANGKNRYEVLELSTGP